MTGYAKLPGVRIKTWMSADPRISKAQHAAIIAASKSDGNARVLGLDYAMRPVISAALGTPRAVRTYAVMRNGDPTEPKHNDEPVLPGHERSALMEPWGETTQPLPPGEIVAYRDLEARLLVEADQCVDNNFGKQKREGIMLALRIVKAMLYPTVKR